MDFQLVSLDGVKYSAEAYSVILPTAAGQVTILPHHEPMLSVVVPGVITIRRNRTDADTHLEHYAIYGGVLEVGYDKENGDYARVLVDEATHGDEVNEAEAEKAYQAALVMRQNAKDQVELDKAQGLVDRHAVRLEVAQMRRRHQRR